MRTFYCPFYEKEVNYGKNCVQCAKYDTCEERELHSISGAFVALTIIVCVIGFLIGAVIYLIEKYIGG